MSGLMVDYIDIKNIPEHKMGEFLRKRVNPPTYYIDSSGQRVDYEPDRSPREPPTRPTPRPPCGDDRGGFDRVRSDSELATITVHAELGGRDAADADEYRATLQSVANEKGWLIEWVDEADPGPKRAAKPKSEPSTPKRKRGRHKRGCDCGRCEWSRK